MADPFYAAEPDPTRPAPPAPPPTPATARAPQAAATAPQQPQAAAPPPAPAAGAPSSPPTAEEDFAYGGTEPPAAAREPRRRPERVHTVVFKGRAERERRYDLGGEYEVDGRPFDHILIRRMTHGDVLDFTDRLAAAPEGAFQRFPMFYFPWGELVPDDVWEQLDSDETEDMTRVMRDFLPSRFREPSSAGSPTTATGTPAPSSPGSTGSSSG